MSVSVSAGTKNPIDLITDPDTGLKTKYAYPDIRATVTNLTLIPDGLFDQMRDFINLWQHISDDNPTWVSCPESPRLEAALQEQYGVGDMPEDWVFDMGENAGNRVLVEDSIDTNANIAEEVLDAPVDAEAEQEADPVE